MDKPEVIGFDADDTLWKNEMFFREAEQKFSELLKDHGNPEELTEKLYRTEISNLEKYGYGIKSFTLSMIECGLNITDGKMNSTITKGILDIGKEMIDKPVQVISDVEHTLKQLRSSGYQLIIATKGDLVDQQRKLSNSGLKSFFHHIEIMSNKNPKNYMHMLQNLNIRPDNFLMVGNSLKSDIIPLLEIGASAVHIPFSTTWKYEEIQEKEILHHEFRTINSINELPDILN